MAGFGEHLVLHSIPKSKKIVMFREALPCHKGSSIYYVITFGGNHLDLPPKSTKSTRKLRQMGKMQSFGMLTYMYCIFGTSACIYLEFCMLAYIKIKKIVKC